MSNKLRTASPVDGRIVADLALAWTGVENSGRGCSLSRVGFEPLTRPKSFHLRQA